MEKFSPFSFKRWPNLYPVAAKLSLWISACLALLPAVLCAYFIKRYAVNVLYWDEWELPYQFDRLYSGTLTFNHLFAQANEHRIFFPRLLMLMLGHWTHLDTRAYMWATWTMLCLLAVFLFLMTSSMTKSTAARPQLAMARFIPISWMVFNWRQYENLLWGIQVVVILTVLFLTCAIYMLGKSEKLDRYCWLAILCGVVGSFSMGNGLLVWPIGLLQLIGQHYLSGAHFTKRLWIQAGVWSLVGMAVYALYFTGYNRPGHHLSLFFFFKDPVSALQYILLYWGRPLADGLHNARVAGAILFTICVYTIAVLVFRQKLPRAALKFFSLLLFAFLSGLLLVIGRVGLFGVDHPASRYVTPSSYGLIGSFALVQLIESDMRRHILQGFIGSLVLFGALTSYLQGADEGRWRWAMAGEGAFFLRSYPCQPDNRLQRIYPSAEGVRALAPLLEKYHLNVFYRQPRIDCPSDNEMKVAAGRFDTSELTLKQTPTRYAVDLINNHPAPGGASELTIDSSQEATVKITGWAVDQEAGGPPAAVLINVDGQQDFPAETGLDRLGVALFFNEPAYWHSGFVASLPIEKLGIGKHALRLKIIAVNRRQYYRSEQTWIINIR